jgi:hypothetical protein
VRFIFSDISFENTQAGSPSARTIGRRPILENSLVDALCLMQMLAPIRRDARVGDVVMAALDDVDGLNLQVAQVRHGCRRGLRAGAEGFGGVQALGMQTDSAGLDGGELDERILQ